MPQPQITTVRATEAGAAALEQRAGFIVAELNDDGRPSVVDSGTWEHCCSNAQAQALLSPGSVYGVFRLARTFEEGS